MGGAFPREARESRAPKGVPNVRDRQQRPAGSGVRGDHADPYYEDGNQGKRIHGDRSSDLPVNNNNPLQPSNTVTFFVNETKFRKKSGTTLIQVDMGLSGRITSLCYKDELDCVEATHKRRDMKYLKEHEEYDHDECGLCRVLVQNVENGNLLYVTRKGVGKIVFTHGRIVHGKLYRSIDTKNRDGMDHFKEELKYNKKTDKIPNKSLRFSFVRSCDFEIREGNRFFTEHIMTNKMPKQFQQAVKYFLRTNIKGTLEKKNKYHPKSCGYCFVQKDMCYFSSLLDRVFGRDQRDLEKRQEERRLAKKKGRPGNLGASSRGVEDESEGEKEYSYGVRKNKCIRFDPKFCVTCSRCIRSCSVVKGIKNIKFFDDEDIEDTMIDNVEQSVSGLDKYHKSMFDKKLCISCGQCAAVCPAAGIIEVRHDLLVFDEMVKNSENQEKIFVAMVAPAVRATFFEEYKVKFAGKKKGEFYEEREQMLCYLLRQAGFDYVFDVAQAADLCAVEEVHELVHRLETNGPWPMITSCCPAHVNIIRKYFPKFLKNLSTCKSPHMMLGSIVKEHWAKAIGKKREQIVVVSIMPCTAKKDEILRVFTAPDDDPNVDFSDPEIIKKYSKTRRDVDYVLTVREAALLTKKFASNINFNFLGTLDSDQKEFDDPFYDIVQTNPRMFPSYEKGSTGGGIIFGESGGVLEAALRVMKDKLVEKDRDKKLVNVDDIMNQNNRLENLELKDKKGEISTMVVHSGENIMGILDQISDVHDRPTMIECMACSAGCIGGGGNPKYYKKNRIKERLEWLYELNRRRRMKNPNDGGVKKVSFSKGMFQKPYSKLSKKYLHTVHIPDHKFVEINGERMKKYKTNRNKMFSSESSDVGYQNYSEDSEEEDRILRSDLDEDEEVFENQKEIYMEK